MLGVIGGAWTVVSHLDMKIDSNVSRLDMKIDSTNKKIDDLGKEVARGFENLRSDMRRRESQLDEMRGATHVLQGDVGRLLDTALGQREQQQGREPPPCDE